MDIFAPRFGVKICHAKQRIGWDQTDGNLSRTQQRTVDQHDQQSLLLQCFSQLRKDRFQLLFGAAFGQTESHRQRVHSGLGEIPQTVQADTEFALDQLLFRDREVSQSGNQFLLLLQPKEPILGRIAVGDE